MVQDFETPQVSPGQGEHYTEAYSPLGGLGRPPLPTPGNFEEDKVISPLCVSLLPPNTPNHTDPQIQARPDSHPEKWQDRPNPRSEQIHQKLVKSDLSKFRDDLGVFTDRSLWPPEATAEKRWWLKPKVFQRVRVRNRCGNCA